MLSSKVFLLSFFFFGINQLIKILDYQVENSYAFEIMLVIFMILSFLTYLVSINEKKKEDD